MNIEKLYKNIAPRLTNWLVSSGSSYHEACDLVQNTFLKVWKMRDDLQDSEEAVSGLVFTIARNLRKNLARDNSRLTFVGEIRDPDMDDDSTVGSANGTELPSRPATPQLPSDTEYLRKRLNEAFAKLPPVLREAYTLFQIAEMPIKEIARQTGTTENLVKVRIHRAKEKLKNILADLVTF